jgi:hypothetical protein
VQAEVPVRPFASPRAAALGAYPNRRAAASTRSRVASLIRSGRRKANDTEAIETPASCATS